MIKTDIIKTYILKPKYYKNEIEYGEESLYIINNNDVYLYLYITKHYDYYKIKKINETTIIYKLINIITNTINKIIIFYNKKIDLYKLDIFGIDLYYNYNLKISNYEIIKKIDNNIFIIYSKIIKNNIRRHRLYDINYYYIKKYITFYNNYYIIIYNEKYIYNYCSPMFQTLARNYSRNFMIFI